MFCPMYVLLFDFIYFGEERTTSVPKIFKMFSIVQIIFCKENI